MRGSQPRARLSIDTTTPSIRAATKRVERSGVGASWMEPTVERVRGSKAVMAGGEEGESGRMPSLAFIATAAQASVLQDHHAPGSRGWHSCGGGNARSGAPVNVGYGLGVSGPSSGSVEGSRLSGSGVDGSREGLVFGSREGSGTRGGCFGRVGFRFGVRRLGFLRRGLGVRLGPGPGVRFGVGFVGTEVRRRVMAEVASDSREDRC